MLCMNSVVNFVVKLINKPAIQQMLENSIFVDNKRAREQTNVLPKETETVVFRKKIMKRQREINMRIGHVSPQSPRDWDRSACSRHCVIFPPKNNLVWSQVSKKENNQNCFLQLQITQITNKFITKQGNNEDVDYYHYPTHFNISLWFSS